MARILFTLGVTTLFVYLASPLLLPVFVGALFAVVLLPSLEWLERRRMRTVPGSILLTMGVTMVLILPTSFLLYLAAKAGFQELQGVKVSEIQGDWVQALVSTPGMRKILSWIQDWYPVKSDELLQTVSDLVRSTSLRVADLLGGLVLNLPGIAMSVVIVMLSIYFFLLDGRSLVGFLRRNSFFEPHQTDRLFHTFEQTCRSVVLASLVSGVAQMTLFSIVCVAMGVKNVALIGVVVFISSFIPLVGTAPITFGVALQQYLSGSHPTGLVLGVTAIIVATMDNFIRPLFLRGTVNLHPLLAFVAAFGGLQMIGFVGVFLGPIIAALFVVTLQILSVPASTPLDPERKRP